MPGSSSHVSAPVFKSRRQAPHNGLTTPQLTIGGLCGLPGLEGRRGRRRHIHGASHVRPLLPPLQPRPTTSSADSGFRKDIVLKLCYFTRVRRHLAPGESRVPSQLPLPVTPSHTQVHTSPLPTLTHSPRSRHPSHSCLAAHAPTASARLLCRLSFCLLSPSRLRFFPFPLPMTTVASSPTSMLDQYGF